MVRKPKQMSAITGISSIFNPLMQGKKISFFTLIAARFSCIILTMDIKKSKKSTKRRKK